MNVDVQQVIQALLSCGLFVVAGSAGLALRSYLPERHRDHDTLDFLRLAVGALVTFLAIVLGLLTASSKAHFDDVANTYRHLASELTVLDHDLREVGTEADAIRTEMRAYLAAVIFSTWSTEPAPSGIYPRGLEAGQKESSTLSALLGDAEQKLRGLQPTTPLQSQLIPAAISQFSSFINARWEVIGSAHPTIPAPFFDLMLFWTTLMFFGFGLCAPRNPVSAVAVLICAVSLASVIYVILELDDPVNGLIAISSNPLREALSTMDRSQF